MWIQTAQRALKMRTISQTNSNDAQNSLDKWSNLLWSRLTQSEHSFALHYIFRFEPKVLLIKTESKYSIQSAVFLACSHWFDELKVIAKKYPDWSNPGNEHHWEVPCFHFSRKICVRIFHKFVFEWYESGFIARCQLKYHGTLKKPSSIQETLNSKWILHKLNMILFSIHSIYEWKIPQSHAEYIPI